MKEMDSRSIGEEFIAQSAAMLSGEFFPRIRIAVERLTDEQIWWRPNEATNSIGNLMLHLTGNVTQWIIGGVGNQTGTRDRQKEFDERSLLPRSELVAKLSRTVEHAANVISELNPSSLNGQKLIQGNEVTVLQAIYHVVEHFSMHTGQILMLAKMITAKDLQLYEFPDGASKRRW